MDEGILVRLNDTQNRDRILDEINQSTLDDVGPMGGGEQGMKVLQEMNEMVDQEGMRE